MSEIKMDKCPAMCDECRTPYRYVTTATTALRVCNCDDPPDPEWDKSAAGKQLDMEAMV